MGGDGDDNEIEEDNPNGNKSKKKGGKNRGIGEKRAVCSHWSRGGYVINITINARTTTHNCVEKYCSLVYAPRRRNVKNITQKCVVIRGIQEYANLEKDVISGIKQKCLKT